jgi:hypothetical protein
MEQVILYDKTGREVTRVSGRFDVIIDELNDRIIWQDGDTVRFIEKEEE